MATYGVVLAKVENSTGKHTLAHLHRELHAFKMATARLANELKGP